MARSESNAIVAKTTYPTLNLTNYPDAVDTRVNNPNMAGYENLKDYNYAEHINALEDAVMAIQQALGIMPFVDNTLTSRDTVAERIRLIEVKDYDSRYGGAGWDTTQTLVGHTHSAVAGHPSQINLTSDVSGLLPKTNLNLIYNASGLTGADLSMSGSDSRLITDAINDKLSVTNGGIIQKALEVQGSFSSRLYREWDATARTAGTLVTDVTTMTNKLSRGSGTIETRFYNLAVTNLLYGKYVLAVRAKVSAQPTEEVLHLRWYDYISNVWTLKNNLYLKGTDFDAVDTWQMFYLTFDHDGNAANSYGTFNVWKPVTTTSLNVDIDCVYIMPTHPAIYDR